MIPHENKFILVFQIAFCPTYAEWCSVDVLRLIKKGRCKLGSKKIVAHDDVTWEATARKIVKKNNGLAMRIELTLSILMSQA